MATIIENNGHFLYRAQEKKYSVDGGVNWLSYNPPIYRIGDLVSNLPSLICDTNPNPIT